MPVSHKPRRSMQPTVIVVGILLVMLLPHPLVLLLAQSSNPPEPARSRIQGRWAAVRQSLHLPPLSAHVKLRSNLPPLSLHPSSRFDLKRKRSLEESVERPFSFADAGPPPSLYFATDTIEIRGAEMAIKPISKTSKTSTKGRGKGRVRIAPQDR
ncbi:hypothetical protein R3P38DRAFT_2908873 [Favolaschia claudopus]|uniref:Uncharacterized protein n=1 Tax=Favolaschia claudopus TaxID=2862362 RepID=A0AAW0CBL3_9AGAR